MRISDWSSDVCSSDLGAAEGIGEGRQRREYHAGHGDQHRHRKDDQATHKVSGEYHQGQPEAAAQRFQRDLQRSEEHTSELQSLMRISYAVFCLKKKKKT